MQYGILGSGFGIYGYLPAVIQRQPRSIHLLERCRETLLGRAELAAFEPHVTFHTKVHDVVTASEILIIARRPRDQEEFVRALIRDAWHGRLGLEKPLAPDPRCALELYSELERARLNFTDGFTLCETQWAQTLTNASGSRGLASLVIDWQFMAHHYQRAISSWKRHVAEGGGALRFYCIHLLGLLAKLGHWTPVAVTPWVQDGEDASVAVLFRSANGEARFKCDSRSHREPKFEVMARFHDGTSLAWQLVDPFSEGLTGKADETVQDRRIHCVARLLDKLENGATEIESRTSLDTLRLWSSVECLRGGISEFHGNMV